MKPKREIPLRQYTCKQVGAFLSDDALDPEAAQIVKGFLADDGNTARSDKEKQAA